jgi:hypothetical protein
VWAILRQVARRTGLNIPRMWEGAALIESAPPCVYPSERPLRLGVLIFCLAALTGAAQWVRGPDASFVFEAAEGRRALSARAAACEAAGGAPGRRPCGPCHGNLARGRASASAGSAALRCVHAGAGECAAAGAVGWRHSRGSNAGAQGAACLHGEELRGIYACAAAWEECALAATSMWEAEGWRDEARASSLRLCPFPPSNKARLAAIGDVAAAPASGRRLVLVFATGT